MDNKKKKFLINDESDNNEEINPLTPTIDVNELNPTIEDNISKDNLSNLESKSKDFQVNLSILDNEKTEDSEYSYNNEEEAQEEVKDESVKEASEIKNVKVKKNKKDFGIILVVLALIGLIGYFFDDMILYAGLAVCLICFILSVISLKSSSLYAKVALTLSFIEIVLYALMLILGFRFINNKLVGKEVEAFKNDAKTFITEASDKVDVKNSFRCNGKNTKTIRVYLDEVDNVKKISPLNSKYNEKESYVLIETLEEERQCVYHYYVFLKDEKYSLGTYAKPVLLESIEKTDIKKNSIYQ